MKLFCFAKQHKLLKTNYTLHRTAIKNRRKQAENLKDSKKYTTQFHLSATPSAIEGVMLVVYTALFLLTCSALAETTAAVKHF